MKNCSTLDQLKRNFTALVASELRTPVTILLGYANLLEEQALVGTNESVAAIASQSVKLKRLVDSIVTLYQIDTHQIRIVPRPLPLADLAENSIQIHKHEWTQKNLRIENQIGDDVIVEADRELVSLIFANLLSNATKFSPRGGKITVAAQARDKMIAVSVSDQGIGIVAEELDYIFDRFYQPGDPLSRKHNGIGLGLTLAKTLVELHNGQIYVESALDIGSTFHFTLPSLVPKDSLDPLHPKSRIATNAFL